MSLPFPLDAPAADVFCLHAMVGVHCAAHVPTRRRCTPEEGPHLGFDMDSETVQSLAAIPLRYPVSYSLTRGDVNSEVNSFWVEERGFMFFVVVN